MGVIKGDTRSLDNGSYKIMKKKMEATVEGLGFRD